MELLLWYHWLVCVCQGQRVRLYHLSKKVCLFLICVVCVCPFIPNIYLLCACLFLCDIFISSSIYYYFSFVLQNITVFLLSNHISPSRPRPWAAGWCSKQGDCFSYKVPCSSLPRTGLRVPVSPGGPLLLSFCVVGN